MRPDERDLNEEIRSHLALSVRERIERGEDPEAARLAALREFGYVPAIRDSMRRAWYSRWLDAVAALGQDMRVGLRSLLRAKGLAATVVVTLALGIGANAAIFSVVRGVLLRPLVNRGEDRLVYIRQSAQGIGAENMTFSVPELQDFKSRVTTIGAFGDFSTISFTMIGFGEPRSVRAGVVGGSFFDVMGLGPVLGRLLNAGDDGPRAAGAVVLTYRFWSTSLNSDPAVIGKTIGLGPRSATVIGVLEPSVPYPADTEIIANIVTSPHHLGATMVTGRTHRMTELVAIVSQSLAQRVFPNGDAANRRLWWNEPFMGKHQYRIVGVVADVNDENVVRGPALTVYHSFQQLGVGGRVFVHTSGDPYALVAPVRRIIRELSPNQPVERAATLEDVRAEVLAPDRLNAFVISGFAGVALLIAVVGVAGVLAFPVSARVREFGVRLAIGSTPRSLLVGVLSEGALIVAIGIVAGAVGGYAFAGVAASYLASFRLPGLLPILGAVAVLAGAAVLASLMPAARASRVDVLQALRSE